METLKDIFVTIYNDDYEALRRRDDPLFGIPSELEEVRRTKNIIEVITIKLYVLSVESFQKAEWDKLDEVLTAPGWFSLKRVSLILKILNVGWGVSIEQEVRNLPEIQFPGLSSSNSVSFDFKVSQ